eukprot:11871466-Heterocapsa_arctica.AAC.1
MSGTSSKAGLKACFTVFLASGPTARMTLLVAWSFCPIFSNPSLAMRQALTSASATSCAVPVLAR